MDELPNIYVIFICDFDPLKKGMYQYSFENRCVENLDWDMEDGRKSIINMRD